MTSKSLITLFSIGVMAISLLCTVPEHVAAANNNATLRVSATVSPWFKSQARQQTDSYQVTSEDIKRGYTDLLAAVSVQFQTNISQGKILLKIANSGAEQVLVQQAGTSSEQLLIASLAGSSQEKIYDLRVILTPDVVVGTYPLHLSMQTTIL